MNRFFQKVVVPQIQDDISLDNESVVEISPTKKSSESVLTPHERLQMIALNRKDDLKVINKRTSIQLNIFKEKCQNEINTPADGTSNKNPEETDQVTEKYDNMSTQPVYDKVDEQLREALDKPVTQSLAAFKKILPNDDDVQQIGEKPQRTSNKKREEARVADHVIEKNDNMSPKPEYHKELASNDSDTFTEDHYNRMDSEYNSEYSENYLKKQRELDIFVESGEIWDKIRNNMEKSSNEGFNIIPAGADMGAYMRKFQRKINSNNRKNKNKK